MPFPKMAALVGCAETDIVSNAARTADLVRVPWSVLITALQNLPALVPILASYVPVFAGALAFVRWNGGIVLGASVSRHSSPRQHSPLSPVPHFPMATTACPGDKANHVPTVHLAQVLYFLAFAGAFFSPWLLSPSQVRQAVLGSLRTPRSVSRRGWWSEGVCVVVDPPADVLPEHSQDSH